MVFLCLAEVKLQEEREEMIYFCCQSYSFVSSEKGKKTQVCMQAVNMHYLLSMGRSRLTLDFLKLLRQRQVLVLDQLQLSLEI